MPKEFNEIDTCTNLQKGVSKFDPKKVYWIG
jgi:hypothetical protein